MMRACKAAVKENAVNAQSQKAYFEKYETLTKRYETRLRNWSVAKPPYSQQSER